ncbi:MAG: putative peptidoglycan-binding domain-containing protein, partial [Pseudomonadota bacterium]
LQVDGAIGSITAAAAHRQAERVGPTLMADIYGVARRIYYYELAIRRPASRKFARTRAGGKGGWIKRAEEFISPRFHLTQAEHEQITAAW